MVSCSKCNRVIFNTTQEIIHTIGISRAARGTSIGDNSVSEFIFSLSFGLFAAQGEKFIFRQFYSSCNPFPAKIFCSDFSILDSRVFACLGAEKNRRYARCRPGVSDAKAFFKPGSPSSLRCNSSGIANSSVFLNGTCKPARSTSVASRIYDFNTASSAWISSTLEKRICQAACTFSVCVMRMPCSSFSKEPLKNRIAQYSLNPCINTMFLPSSEQQGTPHFKSSLSWQSRIMARKATNSFSHFSVLL